MRIIYPLLFNFIMDKISSLNFCIYCQKLSKDILFEL